MQDEAILNDRSTQREAAKAGRKSGKADTTDHIFHKLGRYEIIEKNSGQLFWKSYSGLGSLKVGRCHIKGGILFLEPGKTELSGPKKREFIQQLICLLDWERTKYFCPSYTLYYSNTGAICRSLGEENDLDGTKIVVVYHKTYGAGINSKPIVVTKGDTKEKIGVLFYVLKTLVMLILKLLVSCYQIVSKVFRIFIDIWSRFRG